jgi:hypothetical protein
MQRLKKGILYSTMWAWSYKLDEQYPNLASRKIRGIVMQSYAGYSKEEKDQIETLKASTWGAVAVNFKGEVNIPILMIELFWSFPEIYGKKVQKWIDELNDIFVPNLNDPEWIDKGRGVAEKYVELLEKALVVPPINFSEEI